MIELMVLFVSLGGVALLVDTMTDSTQNDSEGTVPDEPEHETPQDVTDLLNFCNGEKEPDDSGTFDDAPPAPDHSYQFEDPATERIVVSLSDKLDSSEPLEELVAHEDELIEGGSRPDFLIGEDDTGSETGQSLRGLAGNDIIVGGHGQDLIFGNSGDDVLYANAEATNVEYGQGWVRTHATLDYKDAGTDILIGASGDDTLFFGDNDIVVGGDGADTYRVGYQPGDLPSVILDYEADVDSLIVEIDLREWPEEREPSVTVLQALVNNEEGTVVSIGNHDAVLVRGANLDLTNIEVRDFRARD